ncbi:MAG: hypothetical protein JJE25_14145, partial [Bacteroidia bacterium]|nr:hypothetical protein [Bacteroidia bacterium]
MQKLKNLLNNFITALNNNPVDAWLIERKRKILVLSFLILIVWQTIFFIFQFSAQQKYIRHDATGFNHWWAQEFVYFYYYKNIFPLATTEKEKEFSEAGADRIINEHPRSLRMEWNHWVRFGESARILLYMPHCWITGTAKNPNINFFNGILFITVLCWLLQTFWKLQKPFLGMILVFILGSSPTLVFENYSNNNVFGLMATWALILFCFHVQWFDKAFRWKYFFIAIICGVLAGVIYNVRAETAAMSMACPILYFFAVRLKFAQRILLIAGFMTAMVFTLTSVQKHFKNKFDETYSLVKQAGGVPFDGMKTIVHPLWHPLY